MTISNEQAVKVSRFQTEVEDTVEEWYSEWLLENYPDEIHCKDELMEAIESRRWFKEFCEQLDKIVRQLK